MSRPGRANGRRIQEVPLGWWVVIGALACLAIGVPPLVDSLRFVAAAERATGVIVDVVPADGKFQPIVQYTSADGRQRQFAASETAGDRSYFQVGQAIGVLHPPGDPADARLDTWQSRWALDAILPGLGLFLLVLGILSVRQSRRREGPYQTDQHFPASAARTYAALYTAVTTRFQIAHSNGSTMRIRFSSRTNVFTWGETFAAQVRPAQTGAVVRVTGAGNVPTVLWQTWRLKILVQRLLVDTEVLLTADTSQAGPSPGHRPRV